MSEENELPDPELAALFHAAKQDTLSQARVEEALLRAAPAPAARTPKPTQAMPKTTWLGAKVMVGVAVVSAVIWGGTQLHHTGPAHPPEPTRIAPGQPQGTTDMVPHASPAEGLEATNATPEPPEPTPLHSVEHARPSRALVEHTPRVNNHIATLDEPAEVPTPVHVDPTPQEESPLPNLNEASEGTLLLRARRAVDPATALALTNEHQTLFPTGRLSEERERIAIDALLQLERRAEARQRAERFLARWPASPHRSAVEQALGGSR
jgi:hypothetical protein